MIVDLDSNKLFYGKYVKKEFPLFKQDLKIIEILSDKEVHSIEEISNYLQSPSNHATRTAISRLKRKGIKIWTQYGMGYKLESDITYLKGEEQWVAIKE